MADKLLLPKFLDYWTAERAINTALAATIHNRDWKQRGYLQRYECHILILVPAMMEGEAYPHHQIQPHVLYETSLGEKTKWPYPFDEIARCKALQLWQGRNDDRTDIQAHLLFPGDTPFWGGVKRHGIVVATSGVQPYFDKLISGIVADACVALAYYNWMQSSDKKDDELCFLTDSET